MYQKILYAVLTYFRYRIDESTDVLTIRDIRSNLDKSILQEWNTWEQPSNYGSVIFPKSSIVRIILKVMGLILVGTFEYFALDLP